jgi:hypothetical protein
MVGQAHGGDTLPYEEHLPYEQPAVSRSKISMPSRSRSSGSSGRTTMGSSETPRHRCLPHLTNPADGYPAQADGGEAKGTCKGARCLITLN